MTRYQAEAIEAGAPDMPTVPRGMPVTPLPIARYGTYALPLPVVAPPPLEPAWTADRLGAFFHATFPGEELFVVANREPVSHELDGSGGLRMRRPTSGVVTALEPLTLACHGTWIAHGSGSGDKAVVDERDGVTVHGAGSRYRLRRVWLSDDDEEGYYDGFANSGLWPLCHLAHVKPVFRFDDLHRYWHVNDLFAQALAEESDSASPVVLLQDYHFALAPRMIRERLPRATTITFWHIPWPNRHRFAICPWRKDLLEGLLGSSAVGFQTATDCQNFLDAVQYSLEAHVDRESSTVTYKGRRVLVRCYPISIEWPVALIDELPSVPECRASMRARLGLAPDAIVVAGVDRLDYTKGLEEKIAGIETLLEGHRPLRERLVLVQVAAPTRIRIDSYRDEATRVREAAARVNERYGVGAYRPIVFLEEPWEAPDVFTLFRAADVCAVTSLHDGMNLVAKEFVAARGDRDGVLVLSTFAGAARELKDALVVNPYDAGEIAAALRRALSMPSDERRARMDAMRAVVSRDNAFRWASRMLKDAAAVRHDERLLAAEPV